MHYLLEGSAFIDEELEAYGCYTTFLETWSYYMGVAKT